jgi:hypothetical protein
MALEMGTDCNKDGDHSDDDRVVGYLHKLASGLIQIQVGVAIRYDTRAFINRLITVR